jgi:ABC-2 type transport system permease protein
MFTNYYWAGFKKYIELAFVLAVKNVKVRYKNSILGFFWSLLNPLIFLFIFVVVFSRAFGSIENYPLYALSGIIFWIFFSTTTTQILYSVMESAAILKCIKIPTIIFPISSLLASLINLLLSFIPFALIIFLLGFKASIVTLFLIPILFAYALFIFGISLVLCAFNVYFRDVGLLWTSLIPAFFYLTPIVYPLEIIPIRFQWIIKLNPLLYYIESFKLVIYSDSLPPLTYIAIISFLSIFLLILGLWAFYKLERGFISNF